MKTEQLNDFVKKMEPFFLGYAACENRLKNENGMELLFLIDWKNKTTVRGLHAKHKHSIGCSFTKSPEKVYQDIRRRLLKNYHADFFETKREKIERTEAEDLNKQKLQALASVIGGQIERHYGHRTAAGHEYVSTDDISIYHTYQGLYEFSLTLDYISAMKLAKILKDFAFVDSKPKGED